MSNKEIHSPKIWISLKIIKKYLKGNLLGDKKREVEDKINASAFVGDAVEGFKSIENIDKTEKTINEINRQISLKSGSVKSMSTDFSGSIPNSATSSTTKDRKNIPVQKTILSIAAILIVLVTLGLALWYYQYQSSANETEDLVKSEPPQSLDEEPKDTGQKLASTTADTSGPISDTGQVDSLKQIAELKINQDESENLESEPKKDQNSNASTKETKPEQVLTKKSKESEVQDDVEEENQGESNLDSSNKSARAESYEVERISKKEDSVPIIKSRSAEESGYTTTSTKSLSTQESSLNSTYKRALELENDGKAKDAIEVLEEILKDENSELYDDALWRTGQLEKSLNNRRKAKRAFKDIPENSRYYKLAQKELEEL